jgi:hypothetical protein
VLHGGRKRSIPHVQGNWPTHVFVECMYHPGEPWCEARSHETEVADGKLEGT